MGKLLGGQLTPRDVRHWLYTPRKANTIQSLNMLSHYHNIRHRDNAEKFRKFLIIDNFLALEARSVEYKHRTTAMRCFMHHTSQSDLASVAALGYITIAF